jgi:hypothetical protein
MLASFTSALEKFYEFYLNVICEKTGVSAENFRDAWKIIAKQSERQLGAFVLVYLLENKTPPKLLRQKSVEFRNDVVDRGTIPTKDEAMEFGEEVYELIRSVMEELKKRDGGLVLKVASERANKASKTEVQSERHLTLSVPYTSLGVNRGQRGGDETFTKALNRVEQQRELTGNSQDKR